MDYNVLKYLIIDGASEVSHLPEVLNYHFYWDWEFVIHIVVILFDCAKLVDASFM